MEMENMQTVLGSSAYQVYEMAELLHNLFKILSCKVCMFLSFCLRQMHFLHVLSQQLYIWTQQCWSVSRCYCYILWDQ